MDALATPEQLARRIKGGIPDPDVARAWAVLEDVTAFAVDESGNDWRGPSGENAAPSAVISVILSAARRAFLNPDQYVSEQEGDYMYRLPESISTDVFTEDELGRLRRYRKSSGLWTLKIEQGAPEVHRRYVPVAGGGDDLLFYADPWDDWK